MGTGNHTLVEGVHANDCVDGRWVSPSTSFQTWTWQDDLIISHNFAKSSGFGKGVPTCEGW